MVSLTPTLQRQTSSRLHRVRDISEPRHSASRGARLSCLASAGEVYQKLHSTGSSLSRSRSTSMSSVSGQSRSSTLSSTTSDQSCLSSDSHPETPQLEAQTSTVSANLSPVLRVNTGKTPVVARRGERKEGKPEEMVTIKCPRLTADRTYEEIEIEVPAGVYNNIQMTGELSQCSRNSRERRSFGNKLRRFLLKS